MPNRGELIIYTTPGGKIQTTVKLENNSLWMTEKQIAAVFERDRTVIGRHIKNIINTGELEENRTVQKMHIANSDKPVSFYNLDMIISVGYRVNSMRGTQFRIWANHILKEHLVKGYTINQKRLHEQRENILRLRESIKMIERSLSEQVESVDDARKIFRVLSEFSLGLDILDDFDHERLEFKGRTERPAKIIPPEEFLAVIEQMRRDFDSFVFGRPKDKSFESSVRQIYQSVGGYELYPAIEDKAAM